MTSLSAEDNKLVVLARATRARAGAAEGAALRDLDGRTYAAATVDQLVPGCAESTMSVLRRPHEPEDAVRALVDALEGADADPTVLVIDDLEVVRDFAGAGVPVLRGTPAGKIEETRAT